MKKLIIPFFLILLLVSIQILFKKSKKNILGNISKKRLVTKSINPIKIGNFKNVFRIKKSLENLILFSPDSINIINLKNLQEIGSVKIPHIYNANYYNDTLFLYKSDSKEIVKLINSKVISRTSIDCSDNNICFIDNNYIFGKDLTVDEEPEYFLSCNNKSSTINLINLIKPYLLEIEKENLYDYTEGQIIRLDSSKILYLFYTINKIAIIDNNLEQIKIYKTIDSIEKIDFKKVEVKIPNSSKIYTKFETLNEIAFLQSCGSVNDSFIFIKSDFFKNRETFITEFIDIYDKKKFNYRYSIEINLSNKESESIVDIETYSEKVYILTNNGNLYYFQQF